MTKYNNAEYEVLYEENNIQDGNGVHVILRKWYYTGNFEDYDKIAEDVVMEWREAIKDEYTRNFLHLRPSAGTTGLIEYAKKKFKELTE